MKTKSPLIRMLWSVGYVIVAVVGIRIATAEAFRVQDSPHRDRTVVRKPWRVEPVKVVAAKNKKKEKIEMGKAFDDDDDWLDGFTVTVVNNSDKTVTAMVIDLVFRRDPGDNRPPLGWPLSFGPNPFSSEYLHGDPNKIIKVGETADLYLSAEDYKWLTVFLKQNGFPVGPRQVELVVSDVGFEDGSVLHRGTLFVQDPNNPQKKIPTPTRSQKSVSSRLSRHHPVKTSFMSRSMVDDECFTQESPSFRQCGAFSPCGVDWDVLSFDPGDFTTELQLRPCRFSPSQPCTETCGNPPQECVVKAEVDVAIQSCCHALECEDEAAVAVNSCFGCPEDYIQSGNCSPAVITHQRVTAPPTYTSVVVWMPTVIA